MTSTSYEQLDLDQRAAVEAAEPAICVSAGPGSGKTRTLSHRARHLLGQDGSTRALLLTFTNKAAAEMKSRALADGSLSSDRLDAGTFHGFGVRFLRSHGKIAGIDPAFEILDAAEADTLASEVAADIGSPNQYREWSARRLRRRAVPQYLSAFGDAFEKAKRAQNLVDFDDLVVYPAKILSSDDAIARAYGMRYQHILIDEFQDTNAAHFAIVQAIEPHVATVSVFADDDQAIMRFAGADAKNLKRFAEDIGAVPYPLTRNYRSRSAIVDCANKLIAADSAPSGRQMVAERAGGSVVLREFDDVQAEAREIGAEIEDLVLNQHCPAADIAILTRRGVRANALVAELFRRSVPVTDWRGEAYSDEDKRLFVACLSCIQPQLSDRQAARLGEHLGASDSEERETHAFLRENRGHAAANVLISMREALASGADPAALADIAADAAIVIAPDSEESIRDLAAAVHDFQAYDAEFSVDHLLTELTLKSGGRAPTESGGVKVATLHGTKGLEWPRVYLIGLEEGKLPDYRSVENGLVGDERRTCFVGVSRAADSLTVTRVRRERTFNQQRSRFIAEMGLWAH